MERIVTILLAGGESSRFGRPKQLADWEGIPLLEAAIHGAREWPGDEIVVVLGAAAEEILDGVDFSGTTVVINPEWEEGEASSLRVGLDTVARDHSVGAVIVGLGDQPGIESDLVRLLVEEYHSSDARAVVPKYRYARGYPILLARSLWERFMGLEGEAGALHHLQAHSDWVTEVWFDQVPTIDIDVPTDLPDHRSHS